MSSTYFEPQGFIFRNTAVCTGMAYYVIHSEITMKVIHKIYLRCSNILHLDIL